MDTKFYLIMACDVDCYEQSDEMYLFKHDNKIIGYASEFESATFDIKMAAVAETCQNAQWFGLSKLELERLTPASFDEITTEGLLPFVIGYRNRWHVSEPIHPLHESVREVIN